MKCQFGIGLIFLVISFYLTAIILSPPVLLILHCIFHCVELKTQVTPFLNWFGFVFQIVKVLIQQVS